ncbi:hypothetical protein AVEN_80451-1 [Araneus ventricosus]|uniref:Uncharacterized protein n=1 Tax=Araneus ventricosus TaxID=182803 RepID=A0A4Y2H953_ARAVE|nr:hypothetical protein AVEN_80451-1 [Araneus ventricosus]
MRAVFAAFCVVGVLAAIASAGPLSREKRFAGVYTAAGASPFGAFAGNPYGGAFAGNPYGGMFAANPFLSGFGFGPSGVNRAPVYPTFPEFPPVVPFVIPTFQFPEFKNWYEGENVCKEEKIMNTQLPDDVIPDDWKDDMPNVNTDFSHEQESCKGTDKKYVCVKRIIGNSGEAQIKATKYECCHGFVRDPTGAPGCVESKQPNPTGATQGANSKLTSNDPTYYVYTGNKMQGGSSSSMSKSSSGNIDKVPIQ